MVQQQLPDAKPLRLAAAEPPAFCWKFNRYGHLFAIHGERDSLTPRPTTAPPPGRSRAVAAGGGEDSPEGRARCLASKISASPPKSDWYGICSTLKRYFGIDIREEAMADGLQKEPKAHTLLVAEDDREVRDLLKLEFELEGFTVLTAANGAEAISKAEDLEPDIILMDLLMPIVDGVEATQRLVSEKATKHIPVLMLTVVDKKEEITRALQAGAFDYITKPFFLPELKARVNAALRYKRLYDELTVIKKQSTDNEKLQAVKEIVSGIQESIVSKLTVIMGKVDIIRSKEGNASKEDLSSILNAALKINRSINNLNIFDFYSSSVMPNGQNAVDLNGFHWGGATLQP
jgi:CheY-like chemotaxis protein